MRQVFSDDYMGRRFNLKRYNCWHLARDVWRDMTGLDLGDLTPHSTGRAALSRAAVEAADGAQFVHLSEPRDPCIVLMMRRRRQPHVGVMMRRRVLHLTERGVLHQELSDLRGEFDQFEYYVPREAA